MQMIEVFLNSEQSDPLSFYILSLLTVDALGRGDPYHMVASDLKVVSGKSFPLYICFLAKK